VIALLLALVVQAAPPEHPLWAEARRDPELDARIEAHPELFTPPSWAVVISPEFPLAAIETESSGAVQMSCLVDAEGLARRCIVMSETPEGLGFGDAAMSAIPNASWKPAVFDAVPVEAVVQFTVNFNLDMMEPVKAPPEMRTIAQAIAAEGMVFAACRRDFEPDQARHWDEVQAKAERGSTTLRPYESIFASGYAEGRRRVASDGAPSPSQCGAMAEWAEQVQKDAAPAFAKLTAQIGREAAAQFRPQSE
jgi:Gram-negative bacterial tonB protein.